MVGLRRKRIVKEAVLARAAAVAAAAAAAAGSDGTSSEGRPSPVSSSWSSRSRRRGREEDRNNGHSDAEEEEVSPTGRKGGRPLRKKKVPAGRKGGRPLRKKKVLASGSSNEEEEVVQKKKGRGKKRGNGWATAGAVRGGKKARKGAANGERSYEVSSVEAIKIDREGHREYLIQWVGYTKQSWEPVGNLDGCPEKIDEFMGMIGLSPE